VSVTEYSEAFKSKMVQRMMGPRARSANALSEEVGVHQPTLSRWLREARGSLGAMSKDPPKASPPISSSPASKQRRAEDWSAEERLRVVVEAGRLSDSELGAFLRREGLHEATLREWRGAALEGLAPVRAARSRTKRAADQKRVKELERQIRRKDRALAEAAALLVLQKKVQAIWGDGDDDTEGKSDE
jgi:transposase